MISRILAPWRETLRCTDQLCSLKRKSLLGRAPIYLWGGLTLGWLILGSTAYALQCSPLGVVGGEGKTVSKEVSPPGTLLTQSNWNSDFKVPGNQYFRYFIVRIQAKQEHNFDVKLYLKYRNGTEDNFFLKESRSGAKNPLLAEAHPVLASDPMRLMPRWVEFPR